MLHVANLFHLAVVLVCWALISLYTRRTRGSKFAISMRLLQIVPALFALDMLAGFTVVEQVYGSHQSAVWISRSAVFFPALFLAALWRLIRMQRKAEQE